MSTLYRPPTEHPHLAATDVGLLGAVVRGEARLTLDQGLALFKATNPDVTGGAATSERMTLPTLGRFASARASAIHGDTYRTYIIDRNINYTNVCNAKCTFCAFKRNGDERDAYTLTYEQIHEKIAELQAIGGTQILMQGGMNPDLPLDWYLNLLASIREKFPKIHIHAFSPPEMVEFVHFFNPPGATFEDKVRWVLSKLHGAGLHSLPGGGGEIFAPAVRQKIGLGKCDAESWLTVMYVAHTLGMFTSATMMFGHIEGHADRVHHMGLVRQWQDRALREGSEKAGSSRMGHYKAFITWPFQRENTPLGRVPEWGADASELAMEFPGEGVARAFDFGRGTNAQPRGQRAADYFDYNAMDALKYPTASLFGKRVRMSGASDYLRTQAIGRLMLDNIYSIGSSWVTMGPHVGQVGLMYGANDMGSVMMEENVVSSAGTTYCLDEAVLCRLIRDAGFLPAQRDNAYDILRVHDGANSPDLMVKDWSTHRTRRLHVQADKAKKPLAVAELTVSAAR
jgi:cyclic dehypoxanthinyl futalosine synthase